MVTILRTTVHPNFFKSLILIFCSNLIIQICICVPGNSPLSDEVKFGLFTQRYVMSLQDDGTENVGVTFFLRSGTCHQSFKLLHSYQQCTLILSAYHFAKLFSLNFFSILFLCFRRTLAF